MPIVPNAAQLMTAESLLVQPTIPPAPVSLPLATICTSARCCTPALAAVIADDTADVGVVVVTGRIADDRAADPAAVDHAAVAGAGRQNGDCRVFIRGLVVDERILDAQVADRTALADKAEEAGILIRGGLGFRADGQAGDRVVVAVEDAVEAAAVAADRVQLSPVRSRSASSVTYWLA